MTSPIKLAEFTLEFFQVPGGSYRVHFADVTEGKTAQHSRIETQQGNLSDTDERRKILDQLFPNVASVIRQRIFPKDTLIYDKLTFPTGTRFCNPRYPA